MNNILKAIQPAPDAWYQMTVEYDWTHLIIFIVINVAALSVLVIGICKDNAAHKARLELLDSPVLDSSEPKQPDDEPKTPIRECDTQLDYVSGLWWCLLHDTSFELDEVCYYTGKTSIQYLEHIISEQHFSVQAAHTLRQEAESRIAALHALLNRWEQSNRLEAHLLHELRSMLHSEVPRGTA